MSEDVSDDTAGDDAADDTAADDASDGASGDGPDERGAEWFSEVRSGYDDLAAAYDEQRVPDEDAPLVSALSGDLDAGSLVVDAGCGGGRGGLETLAERHEAVGVDISREQVTLAADRVPDARLLQGDLTNLPLATGVADGLCSLHAVIHVPREHHDEVFGEFARVLRPGGELLVTTGVGEWEGRNPEWLAEDDDESGDDANAEADPDGGAPMRWSFHGRERSRELLEAAGFVVTDETVVGDELGGGEWLFVRARLSE